MALLAVLVLVGCEAPETPREGPEMPEFADQGLAAGRGIWMGTCRNCHLLGVAGAPAVTDFAAWDARLAKGRDALYQSALYGVHADDGTVRMPPQGGNRRLSQDQVRLAVDYKMAAIEVLRQSGASR
jgi:cytochrome c5